MNIAILAGKNMRAFLMVLALIFGWAGYAWGQALVPAAQVELDTGGQARFIIWIDTPSVSFDQIHGDANEVIADHLATYRSSVLSDIFAVPVEQLRDVNPGSPQIVREMRYSPMAAIVVDRDQLALLQADPRIRRIEADGIDRPAGAGGEIAANRLIEIGFRGEGQVIAIVDTGVATSHSAFTGRRQGAACFSSNVTGDSVSVCPGQAPVVTNRADAGNHCDHNAILGCGHGTAVAGVAVGESQQDGQSGSPGMAPGALFVPVQVFSNFDSRFCPTSQRCALSYVSDQVAALEWLYQQRELLDLSIVNLSLGGGAHPGFCPDDPRAQIIGMLHAAGISVVAAAGNDGSGVSVTAPGCIENVITVSAIDSRGQLESYSNFGIQTDVLAQGSALTAEPNGGRDGAQGTSIAAPHISGVLAILRQFRPEETPESLINSFVLNNRDLDQVYNEYVRRSNSGLELSPLDGIALDAGLIAPAGMVFGPVTISNPTDQERTVSLDVLPSQGWLEIQTSDGRRVTQLDVNLGIGETREIMLVAFPPREPEALEQQHVYLRVDGSIIAGIPILQQFSVPEGPAENDDFADAITLSGHENTILASFNGSTVEEDEPNLTWREGLGSLWWRWTAPFDHSSYFRVNRSGVGRGRWREGLPGVVSVYQGDSVDALTRVDLTANGSTWITFDAVAGETYQFVAMGAESGPHRYGIYHRMDGPPPNDEIGQAADLSGAEGSVRGTTQEATADLGQRHRSVDEFSVWYLWRAPGSQDTTFELISSASTQRMEVYALDQFGELSLIGETDGRQQAGNGVLRLPVQQDAAYYIKVAADRYYTGPFELRWSADIIDEGLRSAILPSRRTVSVGGVATAFLTVINPASRHSAETGCRLEPPFGLSGDFAFQETDPATNVIIGTPDAAFDLAIGQSRSFVFSIQSNVAILNAAMAPRVNCGGVRTTPAYAVNSFEFSSFNSPLADVIASAVSASGDGVVRLEQGRATAVALAAVNIGRAQTVTLSAEALNAGIASDFSVEFCITDPTTGACLGERSSTVTFDFASEEVRTFTAFIRSNGGLVAFAPRTNRLGFVFERFGQGGLATSLALTIE
ncbi:S8 family peptidase [Hyphobacterium sp.]|uniref:S8 family peptidase n=1 Tax=Hyphobacterium sp. TaxID=2004662 RepID=UPI003BAAAD83